jgi:hypothetical protein
MNTKTAYLMAELENDLFLRLESSTMLPVNIVGALGCGANLG